MVETPNERGAGPLSKKHPQLFHYTNITAFKSICASQRLWATHYKHLNDSSELGRFRFKLTEFMFPLVQQILESRAAQRSVFGEGAFADVFICSFCAHEPGSYAAQHGLLSQWRGYGSGGSVALVFDASGLENRLLAEKDSFAHPINHLGDLAYDNAPNFYGMSNFAELFQQIPDALKKFYQGQDPGYEALFRPFIMGSTLTKHHAFQEENEIRIVVAPIPTNPASDFFELRQITKPIKYRERNGAEVQYIELFGDAPLPIKRIIVGPSKMQNLNYQTVMETVGGSGIEVARSATPFTG